MANSSGRGQSRQKFAPNQLPFLFDKPEDLRNALNSIDPSVAGIGPHRMEQVREVVMSIWLCGRENGCRAHRATLLRVAQSNQSAESRVVGSEAAFKRALSIATKLGFVRSTRSAGPWEREVIGYRIKELVELSRERAHQVRLARVTPVVEVSHECAMSEPSVSHDCAMSEPRPLLYTNHKTSKPNQSSETSSSSTQPTLSAEEEEVFSRLVLRLLERGVVYAEQAVISGLRNGCTLEQLRERAWWWIHNAHHWPEDSRARTLYLGIAKAVPGLPSDKGWGDKVARART